MVTGTFIIFENVKAAIRGQGDEKPLDLCHVHDRMMVVVRGCWFLYIFYIGGIDPAVEFPRPVFPVYKDLIVPQDSTSFQNLVYLVDYTHLYPLFKSAS